MSALPVTADMPSRWLRPGDRIIHDGAVREVSRVEFTPGEPLRVSLKPRAPHVVGAVHQLVALDPMAAVARVLARQPATLTVSPATPPGALL